MDRALMRDCGLMPWDLDRLTLSEMACLLDSGEDRGMSDEDIDAHIQWWASLSPLDKLQNATLPD